jgi:hypothetical protein
VGQQDNATKAMQAYEKGFRLVGADAQGYCLTTQASAEFTDYGDPIVTFGEDLLYGCAIKMNRAQLEQYCNGGD